MTGFPPAIFLMGPTAAGKTALAVELVKRLPCEIISVDSALVYRGMDIGTAKPDAETLRAAPHRLLDICDPMESYSAARFRADALHHMAEISEKGNIPLLVGGTGLYFRALQHGLADLPDADPVIRCELDKLMGMHGLEALHRQLHQIDPDSAQRIHPHDRQRIQRALEIYRICGKPMSSLLQQGKEAPALPYRVIKFALFPEDREVLRLRIATRFDLMLEQGLLEEVSILFRRPDLHSALPAMRAVGYRQIWAYLNGEITYAEMRRLAVTATRQLAKRQFTWLRRETGTIVLDSERKNVIDSALKYL